MGHEKRTYRSVMIRHVWAGIVATLVFALAPQSAAAQDVELENAKEDGVQLLMRHAIAPGTGDPSDFAIGDCSTQRNLSEEGRDQARAIGERIRADGIGIDVVLTSQWCRCRETAELLDIGPVEDAPFLNSFFGDRSTSQAQTEAARERIRELAEAGRRAMLVTHQVNITALTDVFPSSGEIVLVAAGEDGSIEVRGSIDP
ncbi:Phosphoglycerate mutase family protein [Fulvimarina pelagi HTCC2506]|uniref:Phosphoglycerate mutase family protein n=1 Tax=Fulvimarina pelagi HTCC2506 TaxID=314231 RepID=Q0G6V4_9HYPH|nr:histidine phosphatase family protein [Fulvimarina pelagi]EAU42610.1 Phosphoglycerate mutase family protein [Fulvimarina pelagi HTCC2506]